MSSYMDLSINLVRAIGYSRPNKTSDLQSSTNVTHRGIFTVEACAARWLLPLEILSITDASSNPFNDKILQYPAFPFAISAECTSL